MLHFSRVIRKAKLLLLCGISAFSFAVSPICSVNVYARDPSINMSEYKPEWDNMVIKWYQGRVPAGNWNSSITGKSGSSSVGDAACSHFATTYMLVKAGIFNVKNGDNPKTQIMNARKYNAFEESWGLFDFRKINKLYHKVQCVDWKVSMVNMTFQQCMNWMKGKMNEGLFCVPCVTSNDTSGHYIFCDGFTTDGDMIIGDSAFAGTKWSDYYSSHGGRIVHVTTFKVDGVNAMKQPSIYEDVKLSSTITKSESQEYEKVNKIVKENELVGMPDESKLLDESNPPVIGDASSLSLEDIKNLSNIKNNLYSSREEVIQSLPGTIVHFLGLALICYAMLLFISVLFDYSNNWIDVSLVSLFTLGYVHVASREDISAGYAGKGYIGYKQFFIKVCIVLIVGIVMVSGVYATIGLSLVNLFKRIREWL